MTGLKFGISKSSSFTQLDATPKNKVASKTVFKNLLDPRKKLAAIATIAKEPA